MDNKTREQLVADVIFKAQRFVDQVEHVSNHPEFAAVFTLAYTHGGYKGPQYGEELKALKEALQKLKER